MCAQKLSFDYAHTVHTVRIVHNAHNDGKLTIIFGGGYEIEETLQKARSQDTEKTGGMRTLLQEFSLRGWYHILIPQTARRKQTNIFSQDGICQGGFLQKLQIVQ